MLFTDRYMYFDNISIGCEISKYGEDCISCQGCQTCNIESGKCGMFFTWLIFINAGDKTRFLNDNF